MIFWISKTLLFPTVVGCLANTECNPQQACINGNCQDPCSVASPCRGIEECQVQNHQPVCVKGAQIFHLCFFNFFISELEPFSEKIFVSNAAMHIFCYFM